MSDKPTPLDFDCEEAAQEFMAEILGDALRSDLGAPEYVRLAMKLSALLRKAHGSGISAALQPLLEGILRNEKKRKEGGEF